MVISDIISNLFKNQKKLLIKNILNYIIKKNYSKDNNQLI